MAFDRTMTVQYSGTGVSPLAGDVAASGDTEISLDFSVPASTTDQEQQFGFDAANVKAVYVTVDGAVTCETNNSSAPSHTFAWSAAGHLVWSQKFPAAVTNPFGTTDVTTTYWTNAGASAVAVKVRILLNS